ncbi:alpha/beta hydrolase [Teredinibacter turnerae]|uniref:alpha/beta hydrolase n=1 Tax=Teredinibacter turnerae TaxID=2426 RepID=UPI00039F900A|nr:alpha/beta hydrolase [Teredinibacter turnerae]
MDKYLNVNGIKVHYKNFPGGGKTLLLVHGLTQNIASFDGLIDEGLANDINVVMPDLRGRGLSEKPETGYSVEDHSNDLLELIKALDLKDVALAGHSYGALLCYYLAARNPKTITSLISLDTPCGLHPEIRKQIQAGVARIGKKYSSWDEFINGVKQMPHLKGWWNPRIESLYRADAEIFSDGSVTTRSSAIAIAETVDKAFLIDWNHILKSIEQPLLMLNATGPFGGAGAPPMLPKDSAMAVVNGVKNGVYVDIPGNHITMLYGNGATKIVSSIKHFLCD